MGVISNVVKGNLGKYTNPRFYNLLRLILNANGRSSHKTGIIKFDGLQLIYNDATALMGMYNEIFYQEHYKFISSVKEPIIIDCGANIGLSVLYFKMLAPKASVIAIEADPDVAEILKKNLEINNCQAEIVTKAVWTTNNEILSFGKAGADAGSLFSTANVTLVETIRLKDIIEKYSEIELLKIDIEGAEIDVIKDCKTVLFKVKKVFIEFHSFPDKPQQLEDILSIMVDQGFRYKILPARKMKHAFMPVKEKEMMDLQLNIFFQKK
jgi:FkbM family methyltransferase